METYPGYDRQSFSPGHSLKIPEGCETEIRLSGSRNEFTLLMKFSNLDAYEDWIEDGGKYDEFLEELAYSFIGTVIFVFVEELANSTDGIAASISGLRRVIEMIPTSRRGRGRYKVKRYFEEF